MFEFTVIVFLVGFIAGFVMGQLPTHDIRRK